MSDDDDFMQDGMDDGEQYDFDYEEDEEDAPDVDLENKYYNAKGKSRTFYQVNDGRTTRRPARCGIGRVSATGADGNGRRRERRLDVQGNQADGQIDVSIAQI